MADYVCIDGPLEGRRFRWRKAPPAGEPMTVAVVDVDNGVLEVDYRVQPAAGTSDAGRLEFVAARDARPRQRRLGRVSEVRTHVGRLTRPFTRTHA